MHTVEQALDEALAARQAGAYTIGEAFGRPVRVLVSYSEERGPVVAGFDPTPHLLNPFGPFDGIPIAWELDHSGWQMSGLDAEAEAAVREWDGFGGFANPVAELEALGVEVVAITLGSYLFALLYLRRPEELVERLRPRIEEKRREARDWEERRQRAEAAWADD